MSSDTVSSVASTYSIHGLDREALALERRIFLESPLGRALLQMLVRAHNLRETRAFDFPGGYPFEKVSVRRDHFDTGWVISGVIGETVYSLAVTDVEIQYSNLV